MKLGMALDNTKFVKRSINVVKETLLIAIILVILIIYLFFRDWIIARFGVLEFLSSNVANDAFTNDQTRLRGIQHVDAGPRHASSFVFADAITIQ